MNPEPSKISAPEQKKIEQVQRTNNPTPQNNQQRQSRTPSFPHPQPTSVNNKDVQKQKKNRRRPKNAFDIEVSEEEFDFEKNLALFDKQAVFKEIEAGQNSGSLPPDVVSQTNRRTEDKYRHDENVLQLTNSFRQIQLEFDSKNTYYTDEALITIPSIPQSLRNRIQNLADSHGFDMNRQNDMLARGACDLALQLLGGSRRLTPKNQHQWPKLVVICDEPYNDRQSEIGISTGRLLASHGLKVMVYVKTLSKTDKPSKELELFTATSNDFTYNISDLFPSCDLIILAVKSMNLNSSIIRYIQNNGSPVLAVDPPITGVSEISIKYSILPILPLDDIKNCGKLYLCNLGVPEKFFRDSGIKYYSPFGSKSVIPLHPKK